MYEYSILSSFGKLDPQIQWIVQASTSSCAPIVSGVQARPRLGHSPFWQTPDLCVVSAGHGSRFAEAPEEVAPTQGKSDLPVQHLRNISV
jgi:hypothetical protein